MPVIEYNNWFDEDSYMDEMARMHKLSPKLDIVNCLNNEFDLLRANSQYRSNLTGGDRQWYLVELSGQIVALSLELTDDLAATCLAYMKSIANRDKCVIERISNYETREGHRFFEMTSQYPDYSAEAVGLDPGAISSQEKDVLRQRFAGIKAMRDLFWDWYNGYKHGQYATPVVLTAKTQQGLTKQEWVLYLIPKRFRRDIPQKKIHTEDKFINTVENVSQFTNLARESVALWLEMRNRQYPKIFNRAIS